MDAGTPYDAEHLPQDIVTPKQRIYKKPTETPTRISQSLGVFYRSAYHKFYIDEVYLFITKKILFKYIGQPFAWFDKQVIDGLVRATGSGTTQLAAAIKNLQSGKLQSYALIFFIGILLLICLKKINYHINRFTFII